MKNSEDPEVAYNRRVKWHNDLMTKVNEIAKRKVDAEKREEEIKRLLSTAIENLHKTVDSGYSIDNDPKTKKRLEEIAKEIVAKKGTNLRKGEGEGLRVFKKFFSSSESVSDFFDILHKAIIAKQESMGIPYRTEPDKPRAQPETEATRKRKAPASSTSTTKVSTTTPASAKIVDTNPGKAPSSGATRSKSRSERALVVGAEKEKVDSVTKKPKRKKDTPPSVTRSDVRTDEGWNRAFDAEGAKAEERAKKEIALSKPVAAGIESTRNKIATLLATNPNVRELVKKDREQEKAYGGDRSAVLAAKQQAAREEMAASATTVHPSKTPTTPKAGTYKGK